MPSELISIHLDPNNHGEGNINAQTTHSFVENTKICRVFDDAFNDNNCDDGDNHCDPDPITGSGASVYVEGILVHRDTDIRTCGGRTVTNQVSNVYAG